MKNLTLEDDECICSINCEAEGTSCMGPQIPEHRIILEFTKNMNLPLNPPPTPGISKKFRRLDLEDDECLCGKICDENCVCSKEKLKLEDE